MRHSALVAVCALLSTLASAGPPSDSLPHHSRARCADAPLSRWRTLSSRIIESIWRPDDIAGRRPDAPLARSDLRPPSHSLARYGGDVVLRFNITTAEEARSMAEAADTLLLDVWEFSKDWVDIRMAKDIVPSLLGLLPQSLQHAHTPLLRERDLIQAIYETYPASDRGDHDSWPDSQSPSVLGRPFSPSLQSSGAETNIFFNDYQPLSVIQPWMRLLASLFTTHVRLINIGYSYQGREIPALRVGVHPTNDDDPEPMKRKTVLITGGLHAREWIGTTTVNYVAYSLVTGYGKNPHITKLLEDFDFVFIPTLNPDGYVYTWETDRLWRKNRQQTNVRFCPGIDLDRGFGYQWDGHSTVSNPCSEAFAGEQPFEAVEATRLAEWARNETDNNNVEFVGFLDLHSYSQEILYPYSYTCDFAAPGQENLEELALGLEKTIRVSSGQIYEVMAACKGNVAAAAAGQNVLLPRIEDSGGSALDWFYHTMHVRYAYQIKLRDRGTYGFLLPRENIVPTGNEIWEAVLYFASFLSDVFVADEAGAVDVQMSEPHFDDDEEALDVDQKGSIPQSPLASSAQGESLSEDEEWIWVEDVPAGDHEWELRRRRRR